MSAQTELVLALGSLFGSAPSRLYPLVAPSPVGLPYAVYQVISQIPYNVLTGAAGLYQTRIQLDVFARLYSETETLKGSVRTAMASAFADRAKEQGSFDIYEEEPKLHRLSMDWSIVHT